METICRLCLQSLESDGIPLFDGTSVLLDLIQNKINVQILYSPDYPETVCQSCSDTVQSYVNFQDTIQQNQDTLLNDLLEKKDAAYIVEDVVIKAEEGNGVEEHYEVVEGLEEVLEDLDPGHQDENTCSDEYVPETRQKAKKIKMEKETITTPSPIRRGRKSKELLSDSKIKREPISASSDMKRKIQETMVSMNILVCEICNPGKTYKTLSKLHSHYETTHGEEGRVMCCDKVWKKRTLNDHIWLHLDPDAFKCDVCGKQCSSSKLLFSHRLFHLPASEKPFKCNQCEAAFMYNSALKIHQKTHTPQSEKSLLCPTCGKAFAYAALLKAHVDNLHNKSRPFVCDICGMAFFNSGTLKTHISAKHTQDAERKECYHCGKFFRNLRSHLSTINVDGREFKCGECDAVFRNHRHLLNHRRSTHRKPPEFQCQICDKVVSSKKNYLEHQASHTGKKLYTCKFCPKEFNSNANKYKHQKQKHQREWEEWKKIREEPFISKYPKSNDNSIEEVLINE